MQILLLIRHLLAKRALVSFDLNDLIWPLVVRAVYSFELWTWR